MEFMVLHNLFVSAHLLDNLRIKVSEFRQLFVSLILLNLIIRMVEAEAEISDGQQQVIGLIL